MTLIQSASKKRAEEPDYNEEPGADGQDIQDIRGLYQIKERNFAWKTK